MGRIFRIARRDKKKSNRMDRIFRIKKIQENKLF